MDQYEVLSRLGLALAIGFLIGIERGWREREEAEGDRTAGLRTFTLIALAGAIFALLATNLGPLPFAAAFLATAGALTLFRWKEQQRDGRVGVTTLVAGFLTFGLGAYAAVGDRTAAAAAAVTTAALLAAKPWLHAWIKAVSWAELRATLIILAMSFIALPVLPDRGFGPYEALNPHTLWLMTIAVAGVSFVGYVAVKVGGDRYGALIAGIAGGMVSSTVTTLDFARRAKVEPASARLQLAGALAASAVMFLRVGLVVAVFGSILLPLLAGPILTAGIILILAAVVLDEPWRAAKTQGRIAVRNPLDLGTVAVFAVVLIVVFVLSKTLIGAYGGSGGIVLAAIAGTADVDAITLSMTQIASGGTPLWEPAAAILIAVAVNSVAKSVVATVMGGLSFGLIYSAITLAALVAGALVAFANEWAT